MNSIIEKIILAATISVTAAAVFADDPTPLTSQQFVWEAGTGGMKEVYLSQVALQKSQNADVQSFAEHMVRDHSSANKKLMKIANDEALDFPPTNLFSVVVTNSPDGINQPSAPFNSSAGIGTNNLKGAEQLLRATQSATNSEFVAVRQLEALPEPQFDAAYAGQMVQDHMATIHLFEQASADVPDKDLKKFITKTLPTLHKHYDMAQELENKLTGVTSTNSPSMGTPQ
jgi:putative membrane protein